MALKFEIDSLDGVDDAIKPLYQEHGGIFRLAVDGLDDAVAGKPTLIREREDRKSANERALQAEREAEELRRAVEEMRTGTMEKNKEFESLWKTAQAKANDWQAKFEALEKHNADKERREVAYAIAREIARTDAGKQDLLAEKIMAATAYVDGQVQFTGEVGSTAEQVQKYFTSKYPFLADGLQSSGGNATGGARITAGKKFSDYTAAELSAIRRDNPTEYDRLRTQR